ncbi:Complex 1 protein (LYR family), putative [Angomonas deanei]|uniref:Complex 1 protein (LYR family), putative n=1 Tax=Angomonas deanei TaxID=59799 RepID=A0A7G2CNL5_9TRYP|nr:Complex 1 protein (LYR family), putative [Angomonas deanei]
MLGGSVLRPTSIVLRWKNKPQVLGTEVPSYKDYPYRATDVLYLYKSFLQLIYHHHRPEERADLLFRLRNEFASKRHLSGPKMISAAIRKGEGILALQRQILDAKEVKQRSLGGRQDGAQSVDGLWDQLRTVSGNVLPGLQNYGASRPISGGSYTRQASTGSVYSRRIK